MNLWTKLRYAFARGSLKAAALPFVSEWVKTSWIYPSFERLTDDGYKANAAVHICITKLALAYQQPRPTLSAPDGALLPNHPLQALLNRPNPLMSWAELAIVIATYKAIGGRCMLHKVRNNRDMPIELWPYHIGQMRPVPGRFTIIDGYEVNQGLGEWKPVDKADVIDLKWPTIDPAQPWNPIPPLRAIAHEVATDAEATRYQYALLANDATVRGALTLPPGITLTDQQYNRLRAQWAARQGGDNRGGLAILEGGARYDRISLSIEELAFDALRRVPEARISAGFLIPPEVSGLTVGLEHSTYNNVSEARRGFFEDTIVQLCGLDAGELTADLGADFGGNLVVGHDYSKVVALQENQDAVATRVYAGWDAGLIGLKEARRMLQLPEELPADDTFKVAAPAPMPLLPEETGEIIDVTPIEARARRRQLATKATAQEQIEARLRRDVEKYLVKQYRLAAQAVGG